MKSLSSSEPGVVIWPAVHVRPPSLETAEARCVTLAALSTMWTKTARPLLSKTMAGSPRASVEPAGLGIVFFAHVSPLSNDV